MADLNTDNKPELRTARDQAEGVSPERASPLGDAEGTTTAKPLIFDVPVARNAKNRIVFTDRFVTAIGGSNKFIAQNDVPAAVKNLTLGYPAYPPRDRPTDDDSTMLVPASIATDTRLIPKGGNRVICVPQQPYRWPVGGENDDAGTVGGTSRVRAKAKVVTLRFPGWFRLLTISWALTNLIKSEDDWPKGYFNWSKRRWYPINRKIELSEFKIGDLDDGPS